MKQFSLIEKAFFLKNIDIFNDLDLDHLIAIADKFHQDRFASNEIVFEIEQKAHRMYFIKEGCIDIFDNNDKLIKKLTQNDYFGDESLFNENPRSYKAVCSKNAWVFSLSKSDILTIITECPSVAISLLSTYSKSLLNK
ncbi:MAG: cyclic nucleotide-binding domain-containing protein [Parachlamydiales bacterium]|nr:cyclic nucleotide-binding domain-containing protein [Parachlamydiales bacterium]